MSINWFEEIAVIVDVHEKLRPMRATMKIGWKSIQDAESGLQTNTHSVVRLENKDQRLGEAVIPCTLGQESLLFVLTSSRQRLHAQNLYPRIAALHPDYTPEDSYRRAGGWVEGAPCAMLDRLVTAPWLAAVRSQEHLDLEREWSEAAHDEYSDAILHLITRLGDEKRIQTEGWRCRRASSQDKLLQEWLWRVVRDESYFEEGLYFVDDVSAMIDGDPNKRGVTKCGYGTSMYDFHSEWPIDGTGIEKHRITLLDGEEWLPIPEWLKRHRLIMRCTCCGWAC